MTEIRQFEQCDVVLTAAAPQPIRELAASLRPAGFRIEEDAVLVLPRTDTVNDWESDAIATIDLFLGEEELLDLADQNDRWDRLQIGFALGTTPSRLIEPFGNACEAVAEATGLVPTIAGQPIVPSQIAAWVRSEAARATTAIGVEPGTEAFALLIELTY